MSIILLLILATIWGASYLFIKITVNEVPPLTLVAGRLGLGALLMYLFMRWRGFRLPRRRDTWIDLTLLGLINAAIPYVLVSWGEQYIDSSLAALLQATVPLFTALIAHHFTSDERLTPFRILGLLLGFGGVLLLIGISPPENQDTHPNHLYGQLAVIASSVCYAAMAVYTRLRLHDTPPLVSSTGQLITSAAFIVPLSLLIERPFHLSISPAAWGSWLTLTLFGTVIAYIIYFTLLKRIGATFTTMVTYIMPINGLILGALVLKEPINWIILLSLALVLSGALLVRQPPKFSRTGAESLCPE